MVSAQPRHWCNVAEVAGPFVAVGGEVGFVAVDAGIVCCADGAQGPACDELLAWSFSDVVDRVGNERCGFPSCGADYLGDLGDLAVAVAGWVIWKDVLVVDWEYVSQLL